MKHSVFFHHFWYMSFKRESIMNRKIINLKDTANKWWQFPLDKCNPNSYSNYPHTPPSPPALVFTPWQMLPDNFQRGKLLPGRLNLCVTFMTNLNRGTFFRYFVWKFWQNSYIFFSQNILKSICMIVSNLYGKF